MDISNNIKHGTQEEKIVDETLKILPKKLYHGKSDVHLFSNMTEVALTRTKSVSQKPVLQACYGRNFHLEPTLQCFLIFLS